jgi:hypothetical protein
MIEHFGVHKPNRKIGNEQFHLDGNPLGFDVLSFWQWSVSDLVSNVTRGRLAEFLVARALGVPTDVRDEWQAYDLKMPSGLKIEVKSAAYLQSWNQKKLSDIRFGVKKTREWNAETNTQSSEIKRQADIYVFALLHHKDKSTLDPLNVDQWVFYVLPTVILDEIEHSQRSITLKSLQKLTPPVKYTDLKLAVDFLIKGIL